MLGFLELQASQAQNRFYNDLEDWLSSITDIAAGHGGQAGLPSYVKMDMTNIRPASNR